MVYNTKAMYDLALARSLEIGPRVINLNGKPTAAYAMRKTELKRLFVEQGYSPRRHTWINNVKDWDMFMALIPMDFEAEGIQFDPAIIFTAIPERSHLELSLFAQDQRVPHFPTYQELKKCNGEGVSNEA